MAATSKLYVATRKGLFVLTQHAGRWQIDDAHHLAENISMLLPDSKSGSIYAAFDHGHFGVKLKRSDDQGKSWTETAVPEYPPLPEGAEPTVDGMGRTIPNKLVLIWSMEVDSAGRLWCGTLPGGLFSSDDRGESWQLNHALWDQPSRKNWFGGGYDSPGIHSICIDPRDDNRIFVGVSCGGVWLTEDGGQSWTTRCKGMKATYMPPDQQENPDIQDPHRLVQCAGDTKHLWVQHHCGIFASHDGAENWTTIPKAGPSTFGFAVAVHPADGNTAWFVPAVKDEHRVPDSGKLVVTRTRDGGKTFDVLTRGLPQQHAYDIVYRHALAIDETGDTLAFGSTTGSLWTSEDQGDSWQTISNHLPPIYAMRFG